MYYCIIIIIMCVQTNRQKITLFLVLFCKLFHLYFLHLDQLSVEAWTCQLTSNPAHPQNIKSTVTIPLSLNPPKNPWTSSTTGFSHPRVHNMIEQCPMCKPPPHWRKPKWLKPFMKSPVTPKLTKRLKWKRRADATLTEICLVEYCMWACTGRYVAMD